MAKLGKIIIGTIVVGLVLLYVAYSINCKFTGGELGNWPGSPFSFIKECMIPDPNFDKGCSNANDCMYACHTNTTWDSKHPEKDPVLVSNTTGYCVKFRYQLQGRELIFDKNGTIIEEDYPIVN